MGRILRRLSTTLFLSFLLGLPALDACVQAAPAVREIRIAVPDLSAGAQPSGNGVVDVLREQRILEKEFAADGIEVRWNFFKGAGPAINESLANGQVDFAFLGDLGAIIGKSNGLDTRLLTALTRNARMYLAVLPGSGIRTLGDLKGKRVAVFRGTAYQLSFDAALASQGLQERDLQVISLDASAANAALAAKQIDATWAGAGLIVLRQRGVAELPLNTDNLGGAGSVQSVLIGNGAFVDGHPELTARLVRAQQQAVAWLRNGENKQAYIELVSRLASYPPGLLQTDLADANFSERFSATLDQGFLAQLQASVDLALRQRLIRKGFDVQGWVDDRFLRQAVGQQSQ
ncbi:ABC transporter substrate-binding protein [Azorhizophilus paspali]|uniref:ABC transporter substrate-binding protein n=1 Tax=Azorhizophilus paspali TaxID=69963 RepID=A0ABV6SMS9_AZOPA